MARIYSLSLVASALFVTIYLVLAFTGKIFFYESGEAIGAISGWCERVSGGFFREPANTLSNIGFMISGLFMLRILTAENESSTERLMFLSASIKLASYMQWRLSIWGLAHG